MTHFIPHHTIKGNKYLKFYIKITILVKTKAQNVRIFYIPVFDSSKKLMQQNCKTTT